MARITDRLLVQRVDDQLVVADQATGEEVEIPEAAAARFAAAVVWLAGTYGPDVRRAMYNHIDADRLMTEAGARP